MAMQPDTHVKGQLHGPFPILEQDIGPLNVMFSEAFTDRYRRDGLVGVRVPPLNPAIWRYAIENADAGAMLWRDSRDKRLKPLDALKIYALKTSPAFEAAFFTGIRLARPIGEYQEPVKQFARNLGVAFQILNDIKDWAGDEDNKLVSGQDVLAARPTLLLALALEGSAAAHREELLHLISSSKTAGSSGGMRASSKGGSPGRVSPVFTSAMASCNTAIIPRLFNNELACAGL